MEQSVQTIIDQVFREGVEKSKLESDVILKKAQEQADAIIRHAEEKKDRIISDAKREAESIKQNTVAEIQLAKSEALSNFRQQITNELISYCSSQAIKNSFNDVSFIQELIKLAMQKWDNQLEATSLTLLIPEKEQDQLKGMLLSKSKEILEDGIEIKMNEHSSKGFRLESRKNGYFLSFTNEDFEAFFHEHLRKQTLELLSQANKEEI